MKAKLTIIAIVAILVGACTTGTQMTKNYEDDIYFSPNDVSPVVVTASKNPAAVQTNPDTKNQQIIYSELNQASDGSNVVTNSIYQTDQNDPNQTSYDMGDQLLIGTDTTVYYDDDEVKYVINNYYDDEEMSYADQFNRFYGGAYYYPYYDPFFYDDFYYGWGYPYYGWGISIGWGWGYPYYGWGYPYYGWGYPYYGWGCAPYYGCYPGYGYGGYYPYYEDVQVSQRRPTNMNSVGGGISSTGAGRGRESKQSINNEAAQGGMNSAGAPDTKHMGRKWTYQRPHN